MAKYLTTIAAAGVLGLGGILACGDTGVEPVIPSVSQSAQLVDDVDIRYTASLKNVNSATRKVMRNENLLETKTITGPNYFETLEGNLKGDYLFILGAQGAEPDTTGKEVPNYMPEQVAGDSSYPERDIDQGSEVTIGLEDFFMDRNPEDNPVLIRSARVLSGDIETSLKGYDLTIRSIGTQGVYEVEVEFGSGEGGLSRKVFSGEILEVPVQPNQIVFKSRRQGNDDIYVGDLVDRALTDIRRLTTDSGQDLQPAWSPDGQQLAWTTNRDGLFSIYKVNYDGTSLRKLTHSINTSFSNPAWSPDGTEIVCAYIDRDSGTNGVAKMKIDGSGLTKLIENPGTGTVPEGIQWSKEGGIFYNDLADGNSEIFFMNSDGSNQTNLTNTLYNEALPNISPNGDRILYVSDQFGGEFSGLEIMSMAIDGTDVRRITNTYKMEVDPTYSNDGTRLLYSRWLGEALGGSNPGHWQMYMSNLDGSEEVPIDVEGSNKSAVFRPRQ